MRTLENELAEIKEKLAAIESLLQRLPEVQAAVFLQMQDEYEMAKAQGRRAQDLWAVPTPDERWERSGEADDPRGAFVDRCVPQLLRDGDGRLLDHLPGRLTW